MRSRIPAALALAATLAVSASAHAFEVKHADDGDLVRWKRARISWVVDPSVKEVTGGPKAVTAAIAAWTGKSGAPTMAVVTPAKTAAAIEPGFDGVNGVFYAKDGYGPAGKALAITVLSFDERTGEVLDADIILNGKYELGVVDAKAVAPKSKDDQGAFTYDVGRIMAHEMGHALGLSDELELEDSLMYPYVPRARELATKPAADDLEGIATLYSTEDVTEAASGQVGCGAVVAPAGTKEVPGAVVLGAGLVVAAIVIARRKRRSAVGVVALAVVVVGVPSASTTSTSTSTSTSTTSFAGHVVAVRTREVRGVFRTELDVTDEHGVVVTNTVWGGTLDGVKQIVGGTVVPIAGQRVRFDVKRTGL